MGRTSRHSCPLASRLGGGALLPSLEKHVLPPASLLVRGFFGTSPWASALMTLEAATASGHPAKLRVFESRGSQGSDRFRTRLRPLRMEGAPDSALVEVRATELDGDDGDPNDAALIALALNGDHRTRGPRLGKSLRA